MKMEPAHKTLTVSVPNGVLKKHQQQTIVYRECLKNHAASLGEHSLDGCGEFMASPSSNPSDPTSLTCAACGCHRNFHRRLLHHHHHSPPPPRSQPQQQQPPPRQQQHRSNEDEDENNAGIYHGETSSAPHMLMALSAAVGTTTAADQFQKQNQQQQGSGGSRKRFRTKFTAAQKEGMLELSERLKWRMQKRDEGLVEEKCREIGVGRRVFKVWMHNNKYNYVPSPRPAAAVPTNSSLAAVSDGDDSAGIIGSGNNIGMNGPGSAMDTS